MRENRHGRLGRIGLLAGAAGAGAAAIAGTGWTAPAQPADPVMQEKIGFANALSDAFKYAASTIEPSVVHVTSIDVQTLQRTDRYGRPLGDSFEREQTAGLGSGVIIDERGYLVTNNHVIEGREKFVVRLYDGREFDADLVGADASSDIAVLKIDAPGLRWAEWGDSEAVGVGEWVIAVGSPFGLDQTVTAGIVSTTGRTSGQVAGDDSVRFQEFIQTDAAINPGNSGGPLVDLEGRVVGINTAIRTRSGGSNGLGFAVPSDLVRAVAESVIESGYVERGFIGIGWSDEGDRIDAQTAYELGVPGGVELTTVTPSGPADEAGMRIGDIVIAVNGRATENVSRLINAIGIIRPGDQAEVEYIRDARRETARMIVAERLASIGGPVYERVGMVVVTDTQRVRNGRRIVEVGGLRVVEVTPGSVAQRSGLSVGDLILEADGRAIDEADELIRVLDRGSLADGIELRVFDGRIDGRLTLRDG